MTAIKFGLKELEVRPSGIRIKEVTANEEPTGITLYLRDADNSVQIMSNPGHALAGEYISIDEFWNDIREHFGKSSKWWHRNPRSLGVQHRDAVQSYARPK